MAVVLQQVECIPASYPTVTGLSSAAQALDPAALWQRIEAYIAARWTPRSIVWTVEGPGEWVPPLTPATVGMVETWDGAEWAVTVLPASPLGGWCLPHGGPFRFSGTVGAGSVPAGVSEAFRRLAEYLSDAPDRAGSSNYRVSIGGAVEESYDRAPTWIARAIINSGAADLLRPYRRAG